MVSILKHLHNFKALHVADLKQNAWTTHKSNPEHLFVFKAPQGDDPRVQSEKTSLF